MVAKKVPAHSRWSRPVRFKGLSPEERVNLAVEMSSVAGEIVLDSIRDKYPHISERELIRRARKRIYAGRVRTLR